MQLSESVRRTRLTAISILTVLLWASMASAFTPPPASGDWTVADSTPISDQVIDLNGNLNIKSGGLLELVNVTLNMNCTSSGQYGITVEPGGELKLTCCTVTCPAGTYFKFKVQGNASILNSTMERLWGTNDALGGLEISSDGVTVSNTTIVDSLNNGITVSSASPLLTGNRILRSGYYSMVFGGLSRSLVQDNYVDGSGIGSLAIMGSSAPIVHNNTLKNGSGVSIVIYHYATPRIENNRIIDHPNYGIGVYDTAAPVITGNLLRNCSFTGIVGFDNSVLLVENNTINGSYLGIASSNYVISSVRGNDISNCTAGIVSEVRCNVLAENNTIHNSRMYGIYSKDNSTTSILNNTVTSCELAGLAFFDEAVSTAKWNVLRDNHRGVTAGGTSKPELRFNDIAGGISGMHVITGSCPVFTDNNITNSFDGILVQSADIQMARNRITGGTNGINLVSCSPNVTDTRIYDAKYGIKLSVSNSTVTNTTISHCSEYSVYSFGSSAFIQNSTTMAAVGARDFYLSTSNVVALNTDLDTTKVDLSDTVSSLAVQWFMQASIEDASKRVLDAANITVRNGLGTVEALTDENGSAGWLPLTQGIARQKGFEAFKNSVTVTKKGDSNIFENITLDHSISRLFNFDFAPVVSPVPEFNATEDFPKSLDLGLFISDPDHPDSELRLCLTSGQVAGRNITQTGMVLDILYSLPAGSDTIEFTVSDGIRNATGSVTINVRPLDDVPSIGQIGPLNATEDVPLSVNLRDYILDEDDYPSELTIVVDSRYAIVEDLMLVLQYPEGVLSDSFNITVRDHGGGKAAITVNVTVAPVNDPPVIGGLARVSAVEDTPYILNLSDYIVDPDTPLSKMRIDVNSTYAKLNGSTLTLLYPDGVTKDLIRITVFDGEFSAYAEFEVSIRAVNDPPFVGALPNITVFSGKEYTIDLAQFISDPDTPGDRLQLFSNSPFVKIVGFKVTISYPPDSSTLKTTLLFRVSDGVNETQAAMNITVNATTVQQHTIIKTSDLAFVLVPLALLAGATGILLYRRVKYGWYKISQILVIYTDGRMIAHVGADEGEDRDIVSGMLTAVQQFIDEALSKEKAGAIKEFQYEDMKIAVERGTNVYLAVFLKGYATEKLRKKMKRALEDIERKYSGELKHWDGMRDIASGTREIIAKLMVD